MGEQTSQLRGSFTPFVGVEITFSSRVSPRKLLISSTGNCGSSPWSLGGAAGMSQSLVGHPRMGGLSPSFPFQLCWTETRNANVHVTTLKHIYVHFGSLNVQSGVF